MITFEKRILTALLLMGTCIAQEDKPKEPAKQAKIYRLDFAMKEVEDGKTINSRGYSMLLSTDMGSQSPSIRAGSRIPFQVTPGSTQYYDVGVNIDCRSSHHSRPEFAGLLEADKLLALVVTAEISSLAGSLEGNPTGPPIVRQNKWSSDVIVPIGKPTTIFSSDDAAGKRKMQVELTATSILK